MVWQSSVSYLKSKLTNGGSTVNLRKSCHGFVHPVVRLTGDVAGLGRVAGLGEDVIAGWLGCGRCDRFNE